MRFESARCLFKDLLPIISDRDDMHGIDQELDHVLQRNSSGWNVSLPQIFSPDL
jgi:hypothetical protein